MRIPPGHDAFGTGYDVKDYYHGIRVPGWLAQRFGLPRVKVDLFREACHRLKVDPPCLEGDFCEACLCSLPMGWSWAVVLAQVVHVQLIKNSGADIDMLLDSRIVPQLAPGKVQGFAYIDDGSCIALSKEAADNQHNKICKAVTEAGFELHKAKGHSAQVEWEKLGIDLNGHQGTCRPKADRRWRLDHATRALLARKAVAPWELEVVISHYTCMFLLQRPCLSAFHYAYEWVHRAPAHRSQLPAEVKAELSCALGLLPLAWADLRLDVSRYVYATDSSETHYAVMRTHAEPHVVQDAMSWKERWRFRHPKLEPNMGPSTSSSTTSSSASSPFPLAQLPAALGLRVDPHDRFRGYLVRGFGDDIQKGDFHVASFKQDRRALEVFSGSGHWSAALRARSWEVDEFDYVKDASCDLLNDDVFLGLMFLIASGSYLAVHFGTPCRTWSRARSPPLRSSRCLLDGLPNLRPHQRQLLAEGNELTRRSLILMNIASSVGCLVSLENPASSRLWEHPHVIAWQTRWQCTQIVTVYCAWGAPYLKPTQLSATYYQIQSLTRCCSGDHAHVVLRGLDSDGVFKTAKASSYPAPLCTAWALAVDSACVFRLSCERKHQQPLLCGLPTIDEYDQGCLSVRAHDSDRDVVWPDLVPPSGHPPPLPDCLCDVAKHYILFNAGWRQAEAIHMLEARAALKAVCHASRSPMCRHRHVLFMIDNLSACMAFEKGRCTNHPLLRICRRIAAYSLGFNLVCHWRYVESSRNPSDGPTRPSGKSAVSGVSPGDSRLGVELLAPTSKQRGEGEWWTGRHM